MQQNISSQEFDSVILVYNNGDYLNLNLEEITIKKIIPETVSYSYSANFQNNSVLGRFSPIYVYTSGSDETFSFAITIHEDMIDSKKYPTIIDFVDTIKSLSYPRYNKKNLLVFPRIYFQLGKFAGFGIVDTDITWQKPIRNGRYIVAKITFTIRLEEKVKVPSSTNMITTIKGLEDDYDLIYSDKVVLENYAKYYSYIYEPSDNSSLLYEAITDNKVPDFFFDTWRGSKFTSRSSKEITTVQRTIAAKQIQVEYERLKRLFSTFNATDSSAAQNIVKLKEALLDFNNGSSLSIDFAKATKKTKVLGISLDDSLYMTKLSKSAYMKEIDVFIDKYLESSNNAKYHGDTAEAEAFKKTVRETALDIYANIYELWRGTVEYGSSN